MSHTATTRRNRADAMLRQRCPVCLEGKVFHSLLGMNRTCPHCGIVYERETGYFLNAMFVAYVLGFLLFAPLALILYVLHVSALWFSVIVIGSLLIVWPLIFRYSRVVWMHVDQRIDPREESGLESNSGGDPGDAGVL